MDGITVALLVALALAAGIGLTWWWRAPTPERPGAPDALAPLREQLARLDALHADGTLDAEAHAQGRARLERQIVDQVTRNAAEPPSPTPATRRIDPIVVAALLAGLAVVGAGYAWLGQPTATPAPAPGAAMAGADSSTAPHSMDTAQVRAMVSSLEQRLAANPEDGEGWGMLARSWTVLGDPARAITAYRRALASLPNDPVLMADFADALAVSQGNRIDGEALRLVQQALAIDPDQPKALSLAGTEAFDRGDWAGAVKHWAHLQAVGPADHPLVQQMAAGLAEARQRAGLPAVAEAEAASAPAKDVARLAGAVVAGTVRLAPGIAAQVRSDDTVFVFARAAQGPRMPLAVLRRQVKDLPLTFRLDDSLAMSPAMRLSSQAQVVVGARISRSGQALPQPGDLVAETGVVALGREDLVLELKDTVRP